VSHGDVQQQIELSDDDDDEKNSYDEYDKESNSSGSTIFEDDPVLLTELENEFFGDNVNNGPPL
jgi:hypothetical protein